MEQDGKAIAADSLGLFDDDAHDLFASPSAAKTKSLKTKIAGSKSQDGTGEDARNLNVKGWEDEEALIATLQKELVGVRSINHALGGVLDSLEYAKRNVDAVSGTVTDALTLLNTWTRILSQTEHNQRLILNSQWMGASQDIADLENESIIRQQERERKEFEEIQRREASMKKAEEERKSAETANSRRGAGRGRLRGRSRGPPSGFPRASAQGTARGASGAGVSATRQATSSIGRGSHNSRRRYLGT
ncbi:MAG: hypothetical protein Q9167_001638 [Letrouitia subvulpina]